MLFYLNLLLKYLNQVFWEIVYSAVTDLFIYEQY